MTGVPDAYPPPVATPPTTLICEEPLIPGEQFGPYEIQSEIGRGGQAVVFRAVHRDLERAVALKVFEEDTITQGPGARVRFTQEAIAAARVEHPRIVPVYDAGVIDDRPFIAMRLIDGPSLAEMIARGGPLPVPQALAVLDDIAQALDYAHTRGLVHRDLKPGNILIDHQGIAYLSDFGVARLDDRPGVTRPGNWVGTAEYVSPEQVEGLPASPASDRYAFGCLAFEVLTGRPPFVHREPTAVLLAHTRDDAPAASSVNPEITPETDAVLQAAMAKDPSARPASAQAIVAELRTALTSGTRRMTVAGAAPLPILPADDPWRHALGRFTNAGEVPTPAASEPDQQPTRVAAFPPPTPPPGSPPGGPSEPPEPGDRGGRRVRGSVLVAVCVAAVALVIAAAVAGYLTADANAEAQADKARTAGLAEGRADALKEGRDAGFTAGRKLGVTQGMNRGKAIGLRLGNKQGYRRGYKAGVAAGTAQGVSTGYEDGYAAGRASFGANGSEPGLGVNSIYLVQTTTNDQGEVAINDYIGPIETSRCVYIYDDVFTAEYVDC